MRHSQTSLLAAAALLFACGGGVLAQENLPFGPANYEHDFQLFAPFQLDLDNMADDQWSGYFFEYNKLGWWYTGERVTVGNPNIVDEMLWRDPETGNIVLLSGEGQFAEVVYRFNPQDGDFTSGDVINLPPPHLIQNTLHDVPPKAGFALGNRYEFGYRDHDHGWLIGVLDGPELNQTEFYGFARGLNGELPPFIDPDYTDGSDVGPGGGPVGDFRAFGFGAVPILFETPPGYLVGFRDYVNALRDAFIGTQGGPILYVGNYGGILEADPTDDTIDFIRIADDIDGDGIMGADVIVIVGPDGIPRLGIIHDFDDLHEFNVYFNSVAIHNRTETNGVEVMWTHQLTNQHYMAKHQNNRLSVSWGARFLKLYDQFRVDAEGSVLGDSFWDTSFTNQIVGPQLAFSWINERQRWRLSAEGRFMFGYNVADWDQIGLMGEELIPGALNRPLYARPTAFSNGLREQHFSPVGELRVQASYHLTKAFALKLGYTAGYLGNIRRAAPSVRYRLPDMGYVDAGGQHMLMNGVDFGVELVY